MVVMMVVSLVFKSNGGDDGIELGILKSNGGNVM